MASSRKVGRRARNGFHRGFTLAEALLAMTILAIVSAAAALPFLAGLQQVETAARMEQAVALGQALMEEILARPFFEAGSEVASPGPDPGETSRELFNNIDDFHGYAENDGILRNFENTVITDESMSGLWRSVTVDYVTFPQQSADDLNSFVRIEVRVYDGNSLLVTLSRIASRED